MNTAMLLTFRMIGFGWNGDGILLTTPTQSQKLIAVWTQLEPLPLIVADPLPIVAGLMLFGIGHAIVYKWLAMGWPSGVAPRALRLAGLLFLLTFLFWKCFTPFNQFGEPPANGGVGTCLLGTRRCRRSICDRCCHGTRRGISLTFAGMTGTRSR